MRNEEVRPGFRDAPKPIAGKPGDSADARPNWRAISRDKVVDSPPLRPVCYSSTIGAALLIPRQNGA